MTIEVKAEHIACGTPTACTDCATALAIKEATGATWVYVCPETIQINNLILTTPTKVRDFIREYDSTFPVRPYSFDLPIHKIEKDGGVYYDFRHRNDEILNSGGKL